MQQNFAQYLTSLKILFFALLIGQVGVIAVLIFVREPTQTDGFANPDLVLTILPLLLLLLIGMAFFLNRKKLETAREQTGIREKLGEYRAASIFKWAPVEAGTLICAVLFFVSGTMLFVYIAAGMVLYFATQFPSRQRLIFELDLSSGDLATLDDPNQMVADAAKRRNL